MPLEKRSRSMNPRPSTEPRQTSRLVHVSSLSCVLALAALAAVSAHTVKGLQSDVLATAFVSSPSSGTDPLLPLSWGSGATKVDTGLRVACFYVANTSPERIDRPDWPRITSVGFELPGSPAGFALVEPLDGDWEVVEHVSAALPGHDPVTLDVAIRARVNPTGRTPGEPKTPRGVPPGQEPGKRGVGTRFCLSGPFPDAVPNVSTPDPTDTLPTSVEVLLNGVVVGFHGVGDGDDGVDAGIWAPAPPATRPIPLYE
jgi:hypothetical protein